MLEKWASQVVLVVKNPSPKTGDIRDAGSIPRLGRSLGGGHCNPLQYSCLENPRTEERGGLLSIELQQVGHNWSNLACMHAYRKIKVYIFKSTFIKQICSLLICWAKKWKKYHFIFILRTRHNCDCFKNVKEFQNEHRNIMRLSREVF